MNEPHETQRCQAATLDRQIDLLVDGELLASDRRALLLRLEHEPDGWRHCARAFLEAQSWRATLISLAVTPAQPPVGRSRVRVSPNRWQSARLAGLAAGLALMFTLGWVLRGSSGEASVVRPGTQAPALLADQQSGQANSQAAPDITPTPSADQVATIAPVIKQWEERGYQAEAQTRLASVKLKDGRKVEIPVHEFRLRYIRDRTY